MLKRLQGVQWNILRVSLYSAMIALLLWLLFMLAGLFLIMDEPSDWSQLKDLFVELGFHAGPSLIWLILSMLIAILLTLRYIGYPCGKLLKNRLLSLIDATRAVSMGRLNKRVHSEGSDEIAELARQFNEVAKRTEQHVASLQRLVDENVYLLDQSKQAAVLDERRKLARDLHDAVSQQLFATSMMLTAILRQFETHPDETKAQLYQIERMIHHAQQELRALLMHLRPIQLADGTLQEGLQQLFVELAQKHPNITWDWTIEENVKLSRGVEEQIFRVTQEAIANLLRHSQATKAVFKMECKGHRLKIYIEDNGVGFQLNQTKQTSYGLLMMQERITEIGGKLNILTFPNKGTKLDITVPIQRKEENKDGGVDSNIDRG